MDLHPTADGFLLINDDLMLNYWRLEGADLDKIWFLGKNVPEWRIRNLEKKPEMNNDSLLSDYLKSEASAVDATFNVIAPSHLRQFQESVQVLLADDWSASDVYVKTITDAFYVPRRLVETFKKLIPAFGDNLVPSEVRTLIANQH